MGQKSSSPRHDTIVLHSRSRMDDFLEQVPFLSDAQPSQIRPNRRSTSSNDGDEDSLHEVVYDSKETSRRNGSVIHIHLPPPSRKQFPEERIKTVVAFLWLAFNFVITTVSLALTHERLPNPKVVEALPDIILDNVEPLDWALTVSEVILSIETFVAVFILAVHRYRWIVFRRVFFILGWLYLMRSFTMYVTVLPVASRSYALHVCAPKANTTSPFIIARRALQLMSGFGLSMNGHHVYCGDYMYSGHTVVLVTAFLIIQEYSPRTYGFLHWLAGAGSIFGVLMILKSRGHYTIDVLVAYYVTTRLWWTYHTMANNVILKNYAPTNYLARVWWFPVFRYLEGNIKSVVPRNYNSPSACLSKLHGYFFRRNNNTSSSNRS